MKPHIESLQYLKEADDVEAFPISLIMSCFVIDKMITLRIQ